jgi:hypothetical protein
MGLGPSFSAIVSLRMTEVGKNDGRRLTKALKDLAPWARRRVRQVPL